MKDFELLRQRSEMYAGIRDFFGQKNFLEVETPLLAAELIPESCLEVFATTFYRRRFVKPEEVYLVPSPEVWMKQLLASGSGNIFQICKSFRNVEQTGRLHNPEFTMLEWYEIEADYIDSLARAEELIGALAAKMTSAFVPSPPYKKISMAEAFGRYADLDLEEACVLGPRGLNILKDWARQNDLRINAASSWADIFNQIFVHAVEPRLPTGGLFLTDFPARLSTLAKPRAGTPWAERWELYINGVETANCFTEAGDQEYVNRYLEQETQAKAACAVRHPTVKEFYRIFGENFPACSGVALGLDRLLMAWLGKKCLDTVLFFTFSDRLNN